MAWLLPFWSHAQTRPPVFSTTTRLVEVSVTVLDGKGEPVTDLKQEEFRIEESGRQKKLAFFRFEGGPPVEARPKPLPRGTFTNDIELSPGPPRNITALVLDSLNTRPQDSMRVRAQLMRYLQTMAPETRVAVYSMGDELKVLHDFTDDMDSLRERVSKAAIGIPLHGEASIQQLAAEAEAILALSDEPEMRAEQLERMIIGEMMANAAAQRIRIERTLASMEALGRHLAGIPGRKNMVWISGGISSLIMTGRYGMSSPTTARADIQMFGEEVTETSRKLAQDGVVLYIVDTAALQSAAVSDASTRSAPAPTGGRGRFQDLVETARISSDSWGTMRGIASITGGRFLYNTNDLMRGFFEAAKDLRGSYTLGFYLDQEPDGRWHPLRVRVTRPGLEVRHRQGYIAEPAGSGVQDWTPEQWRSVVSNPLGSSAVRLTATGRPEASGIDLTLRIHPDTLFFHQEGDRLEAEIQISVVERRPEGATRPHVESGTVRIARKEWEEAVAKGIEWKRRWTPEPGASEVRVVVRDRRTGNYGTLDLPMSEISGGWEWR